MAKAILISIKPRFVRDILNGDKTIEIRKTIPKCDLPTDVYIYVTKDKKEKLFRNLGTKKYFLIHCADATGFNGKVVAKFTLNKVEKISLPYTKFGKLEWVGCENERTLQTISLDEKDLLKMSCLTESEIYKYLNFNKKPCGYAWHIDKLKIFKEPKELNNFLVNSHKVSGIGFNGENKTFTILKTMEKSPQSWCFIEV